jgi:glycosyltransferase involved in cell wall biosynthesis
MTEPKAPTRCWPTISFIIPVRDDARRLQSCLYRIATNEYPQAKIEVIVMDNGSSDGSDHVARAAGATVDCVVGATVAELRNRGARIARGDVLAFIDADHEIDRLWVSSAVDALTSADVGAVGAPYVAPEDGTWVQRSYDRLRVRTAGSHDVAWLGSGNLAVRADVFRRVGGFDAKLETCEDVDLCSRLRSGGYRVVSDNRLRSVHLGDPPTLRALFLSELWRGRDNFRASLRGSLSLRELASIAIPLIDLAALTIGTVGLLAAPIVGLTPTISAIAAICGLSSIRASRMLANSRQLGALGVLQCFAIASVYDVARAIALIRPASHKTRRMACST